ARARHTRRPGVSGRAHADDLVDALPLQAPLRHREVTERVWRERARGWLPRFEEADDFGRKFAADRFVRRCHAGGPIAAILAASTASVSLSLSVGLNSITSVPAVTAGTWPGRATYASPAR